jgi:23S rRNA (adenine2503-C2)-methyltransferase
MLKEKKRKDFANGSVYMLRTEDGYPIEVTDTFLPYYTKDAIGRKQNGLKSNDLGSRQDRWMIGVSVMSGCPVGCKFCATGKLKKCRNLTAQEIVEQVLFVIRKQEDNFVKDLLFKTPPKEFKINYTRMGEPFLNIENVRKAIDIIDTLFPGITVHHYISTIGIKGADYSWIKDNITLQFSVHSFDEAYRDWLIPYKNKITIETMGKVRTKSALKTTLNLTMAREKDFDIDKMKMFFTKEHFFIKISPINPNDVSEANNMGGGIIKQQNLV